MLFQPLTLRGVTARNRIVVSPMSQYKSVDGCPTDWHLVHLGKFALGGAGLILTESTAVDPRGRIGTADLGLWSDCQIAPLQAVVDFVHDNGAAIGVQLAHAGRKAGSQPPCAPIARASTWWSCTSAMAIWSPPSSRPTPTSGGTPGAEACRGA